MVIWRISNHLSLAGEGGVRASGRWHTRGRRIVYCTQTPAAALLEALVHFEIDLRDLPRRYRLLKLEAPDDLAADRISRVDLPEDWIERTKVTRLIGDAWLTAGRSPMLVVPSALVAETFNVLLNPAHPDFGRIVLVGVSDHPIDVRLLR